MSRVSKGPGKRTVHVLTCRVCARTLNVHHNSDPGAELKKSRWSNVDLRSKTGVCRKCGKAGLR